MLIMTVSHYLCYVSFKTSLFTWLFELYHIGLSEIIPTSECDVFAANEVELTGGSEKRVSAS